MKTAIEAAIAKAEAVVAKLPAGYENYKTYLNAKICMAQAVVDDYAKAEAMGVDFAEVLATVEEGAESVSLIAGLNQSAMKTAKAKTVVEKPAETKVAKVEQVAKTEAAPNTADADVSTLGAAGANTEVEEGADVSQYQAEEIAVPTTGMETSATEMSSGFMIAATIGAVLVAGIGTAILVKKIKA